jgi:predicted nucleic acid-binding protein
MHNRVYFDTNVIVDLFDEKRPFHAYSVDVFRTIFENEEIEVFINTDTLTNLFYILRSHVKLGFDEAIEKLEFIKNSFIVMSSESDEIDNTIAICKEHIFKDYEDGMQYICALKAECTLIITNNPKDFKNSSIEIVTSRELSEK